MKRLFLVLGTFVVILPWLTGTRVEAEAIQWSASAGPTVANFNSSNGTAALYSLNYGSNAMITLGPGLPTSGTNAGSVVLTYLSAFVNLPDQDFPRFDGPSGNYSLSLNLHDLASGASGSLTFRGNLSGFINPVQVDLTNTYIDPTTQTLTLGKNLYTVTIGPYVPPGPPQPPMSGSSGSISASISVQPATSATPEPSSLLLACLGLPPLGLARWLRRRKVVDSNA